MSKEFNFDDDPDTRRPRRRDDDDRDTRRSQRRDDDDDDDDDALPPRRGGSNRSTSRSSPLRFITPGTFGMAVLLFFLPWTDLSCNGPTGKMQMATQSGLQSATGNWSEVEGAAKSRDAEEKRTGKKSDAKFNFDEFRDKPQGAGGKGKKDEPDRAPLLWVYLLLLLGGAVVPVLLAANRVRGAVVLGFAGLAALLLVVQLLVGFPLANAASDFNAEITKAGGPGKNAGGVDAKLDQQLGGMMTMQCSYLASFWITILMLLASGILGLLQLILGGPKGARDSHRRRPRNDPEDEEEEDDN